MLLQHCKSLIILYTELKLAKKSGNKINLERYVKILIDKINIKYVTLLFLLLIVADASAGSSGGGTTIGSVADNFTSSFESLAKLITGASYLAGLGFSIGAIMKFKQHKDNPTQIPIGTPIALLFIAAALLFLPSILSITGQTMFGSESKTAGPGGIIFGGSGSGSGS